MGGGGAGGSILYNVNTASAIRLEAKGGNGANQISHSFNGRHGPGGGGGGGFIGIPQSGLSASYFINVSGGANGINTNYGSDPWGAQPGTVGKIIERFEVSVADVPFVKNIDSIRLKHDLYDCHLVAFEVTPFINRTNIQKWEWDFGDGSYSDYSPRLNHDYYGDGKFTVTLIATDLHGCKDTVTRTIQTYSPTIEVSPEISICKNESVQLFAKGANAYKWTPAVYLDDDDIAEPTATPPATTDFHVTATKAEGCVVEKSVRVIVNELPDVKISGDKTVCINAPSALMASGGTSYSWEPDSTLSAFDIPNPYVTATRPHTYVVTATNEFGCEQRGSISIDLFPIQKINVIADPLICKNSTTTLSATGGSSFVWSPASLVETPSGQQTSTLPLTTDTTFYLTITDQHSCNYTDSVRISVKPEAVFNISADQAICSGEQITLTAAGGDRYFWTSTATIDLPSTSSVNVSPSESTTFAVTISEDACGKTETLYTSVQVRPGPTVTATSSNDISCEKPFSQLSALGEGRSFVWTAGTSTSISSIRNPMVNPKQTTMFTVKAKDQFGCSNTDSVLVKVNRTDRPFVGLPNAFTPNGDGLKDCFSLKSLGYLHEVDFKVYNRFGQVVFHTNDPSACWDGTFKGEPQNAGAFVYTVIGKAECDDINLKGVIMLIR